MKKQVVLMIFSLCLLFTAGCGSKGDSEPVPALEEIYTQMTEQVELPPMIRMEDDYLTDYYGADLSTFEEYIFAAAEDALLAEMIVMVKLNDGESSDAVVKLLENIIKQKKSEMDNYFPEQFYIAEQGEVFTNGNYVTLLISAHKDELLEQLPDALK